MNMRHFQGLRFARGFRRLRLLTALAASIGIALTSGANAVTLPGPPRAAPVAPTQAPPSQLLQSLGPTVPGFSGPFTGPPVAGFYIQALPLYAHLHWDNHYLKPFYNVTLWRQDGPSSVPHLLYSQLIGNSDWSDYVPKLGVVYRYRLIVTYNDQTQGEADAAFTSAALVNPTGFQAALTPPSAVTLRWDSMPGAQQYQLAGPGLPSAILLPVGTTSTVIQNAPVGIQGWQLVAIYNGNQADLQHPSVASVLNRTLPTHSPAWLTLPDGGGNDVISSAHALTFSPNAVVGSDPSSAWAPWIGPPTGQGIQVPNQASYKNVTELGIERSTGCFGVRGPNGPAITCFAETPGMRFSIIVMDKLGARFASYDAIPGVGGYVAGWQWPGGYQMSNVVTYDGEGPKHVPQVCVACHGGHYDPVTHLVQGAALLPIDPGLVQVHGDPVTGDTRASLEQIRQINFMIWSSNPISAVGQYINGLYAGQLLAPGNPGAAQYVPQGWSQEPNLYLGLIKPHCAMCHLAQPTLNFLSEADILQNKALVYAAVCTARSMPHAQLPFIDLYTAGGVLYMPGLLANRLGYANCP